MSNEYSRFTVTIEADDGRVLRARANEYSLHEMVRGCWSLEVRGSEPVEWQAALKEAE